MLNPEGFLCVGSDCQKPTKPHAFYAPQNAGAKYCNLGTQENQWTPVQRAASGCGISVPSRSALPSRHNHTSARGVKGLGT